MLQLLPPVEHRTITTEPLNPQLAQNNNQLIDMEYETQFIVQS